MFYFALGKRSFAFLRVSFAAFQFDAIYILGHGYVFSHIWLSAFLSHIHLMTYFHFFELYISALFIIRLRQEKDIWAFSWFEHAILFSEMIFFRRFTPWPVSLLASALAHHFPLATDAIIFSI